MGSGTQKIVQKQPKSIFPFVSFVFSHYEIWAKGGGYLSCVRYSPSVVFLWGPGQSPVYSSRHDAVSIFS